MERLAQFFGPLRTWDPSQWVFFADRLPLPVAIMLIVAGALIALYASFQMFRFVAAPLGAVIGLEVGSSAASFLHVKPDLAALVAGGALGVMGGVFPPLLVFIAFGGLGGSIATRLVDPGDFWLAFLPGFFLCGGASMFALRTVEAIVSGVVGGALILWGLMRVFGLSATLAQVPSLALGLLGMACLAAVVFQLKVRPTPEEAETAKAERIAIKRKKTEDRVRMERFATYTKKKKVDPVSDDAPEEEASEEEEASSDDE
jgi:hypothetical protein